MKSRWKIREMPQLTGRVAIVTGGNVGLGFKSSLELARRGATVVIACRTLPKGEAAEEQIKNECPDAAVSTIPLDLVDRDSIESFARAFRDRYDRLDILLNNAGVVNLVDLERTVDGHEMHMATNHFGHFALTGRLFDLLTKTDRARVVVVSSAAARQGEIRFDDLDWSARPYSRAKAYGDSKLANLHFTASLQDRFEEAGCTAIAVGAHPGLTATERQQSIGIGGRLTRWIASPVSEGCLPQLLAATAPGVRGRDFFAPRFGLRGAPREDPELLRSLDADVGRNLWRVSEAETGVVFEQR